MGHPVFLFNCKFSMVIPMGRKVFEHYMNLEENRQHCLEN